MAIRKDVFLRGGSYNDDLSAVAYILRDEKLYLSKTFEPFAQFPFFINRALNRAHTWADKMMVVVERHNLDGRATGGIVPMKDKPKPDATVLHTVAPMFTKHSDKSVYVSLNDRPLDRPEQHTFDGKTALTVSAITGSAGIGAAVGIVSGGDIVDSVVGGVAGDIINSAFGDD